MSGHNNFKTMSSKKYSSSSSGAIVASKFNLDLNLDVNFPSIVSAENENENKSSSPDALNYKNAMKHVIVQPCSTNHVKPGWVEYTCDKKSKEITVQYGPQKRPNKSGLESASEVKSDKIMNCLQNSLLKTWNAHKEQYVECYGMDCFVNTFLTSTNAANSTFSENDCNDDLYNEIANNNNNCNDGGLSDNDDYFNASD